MTSRDNKKLKLSKDSVYWLVWHLLIQSSCKHRFLRDILGLNCNTVVAFVQEVVLLESCNSSCYQAQVEENPSFISSQLHS